MASFGKSKRTETRVPDRKARYNDASREGLVERRRQEEAGSEYADNAE